ncbi:MAG: ATP-binding protein [Verrucomicrobiota bacterium]
MMRWFGSFRARVAIFSALLICLIVFGLAMSLRLVMRDLLVTSLDQHIRAQADHYSDVRHFLSIDPYQLSSDPLPSVPSAEIPVTFLAYDSDGVLLLNRRVPAHLSSSLIWEDIDRELGTRAFDAYRCIDFDSPKGSWRFVISRDGETTFVWGRPQRTVELAMGKLDRAFWFLLPLALITAAWGGWEIGRRTLRPVSNLAKQMREIDAAGLDKRLDESGAAMEIRELIRNHNRMLDRLERQFHQASRFSGDAAHELNTPLTVMQSEVEARLRSEDASPSDLRLCESILTEIMRLKSMAQKLLLLAQSDTGNLSTSLVRFDFATLVEDLWEDIPLIKPDLICESDLIWDVYIDADPDLLRLLVQNLLTNAIRYCRPDGSVKVVLRVIAGYAELTVSNTADPIPEPQSVYLFDRFYRTEEARANADGSGLGLSLAQEIAVAHQGDLTLCRNDSGVVAFRYRHPVVPKPRYNERRSLSLPEVGCSNH